jgi:hypothetical protein
MAAGIAQVIIGTPWLTISVTLAVAVVKSFVSVGVNVTDSVCEPTPSTVPAAGVYTKVPATLAVASSWVALSGVPKLIAAGVAHVNTGVPFAIVIVKV